MRRARKPIRRPRKSLSRFGETHRRIRAAADTTLEFPDSCCDRPRPGEVDRSQTPAPSAQRELTCRFEKRSANLFRQLVSRRLVEWRSTARRLGPTRARHRRCRDRTALPPRACCSERAGRVGPSIPCEPWSAAHGPHLWGPGQARAPGLHARAAMGAAVGSGLCSLGERYPHAARSGRRCGRSRPRGGWRWLARRRDSRRSHRWQTKAELRNLPAGIDPATSSNRAGEDIFATRSAGLGQLSACPSPPERR